MALIVNISQGSPERYTATCCGDNVSIDFALTPPTYRRSLGITRDWGSGMQTMHLGPPEFDVVDVYRRIVKLYRVFADETPMYISVTVTDDKDFIRLKHEKFTVQLHTILSERWPIEQINEKIRLTGEDESERICRLARAFKQK